MAGIFDEAKFEYEPNYVETTIRENKEQEDDKDPDPQDHDLSNSEEDQDGEQDDKDQSNEDEYESAESEREDGLQKSKRKSPAYLSDYCVLALSAESYVDNVPTLRLEVIKITGTKRLKKNYKQYMRTKLGL